MACAVSTFEAMCGFRPVTEIARYLNNYPEFREVVTEEVAKEFIEIVKKQNAQEEEIKIILQKLFTKLMTCNKDTIEIELKKLLKHLERKSKWELIRNVEKWNLIGNKELEIST